VAAISNGLRVYLVLAGASIRSQMNYRLSFALRSTIDFFVIISDFAPVYLLSRYFGNIDGWTFAELALLYGMVGVSWGVVETTMRGFEKLGRFLVGGDFDRLLLRPLPVTLQIASLNFEARKIGRILQAVIVLAIAAVHLELDARALGWILFGILGGVLFFSGIVLLGGASQFWTLGETSELQNMLTYGGSAALIYPVSIYSTWFRRAVTYAIPLAFVNYFPALAALGRTQSAGWPEWLPWISPLVCGSMAALGLAVFSLGLRRYESTGT
jgi:ABC-2 type transport system permease protein